MNLKIFIFASLSAVITVKSSCQEKDITFAPAGASMIEALKDTLENLFVRSENAFFRMHCAAFISVIEAKKSFTVKDSDFLESTYQVFCDQDNMASPREFRTYLQRQLPFILAWTSPTDGEVSFSWLNPPRNWDPGKEYPLYIQLHGLWSVASNSIEYLTYPFLHDPSTSSSFEDGYLLSPWGRGNLWYQGISETDIGECIEVLENLVKIDSSRKYLSGHSMGGYGAWSIASKSADTWAALGIHAGALSYDNRHLVTEDAARALKNLPVYFICGTNDGLLGINQTAYTLLEEAGNPNLAFVTFEGGHDYLEENVENMYLWMREFVKDEPPTGIGKRGEKSYEGLWIECTPNPVKGGCRLTYAGHDNDEVRIHIYDMVGRCVDRISTPGTMAGMNSTAFDLSGLMPGIYLVSLTSDHGMAGSKITVIK